LSFSELSGDDGVGGGRSTGGGADFLQPQRAITANAKNATHPMVLIIKT
jgi:hypothetical protein